MYKKGRKIIVSWFLVFAMVFANVPPILAKPLTNNETLTFNNQALETTGPAIKLGSDQESYAHDQIQVTINYTRTDKDYDGWNLWMWPQDGDGMQIDFNQEEGEAKIATHTFSNMLGKDTIGIIVRKGDWEQKDGDSDRFIDLANVNEKGEITIYLIQGDPNIYYGEVRPSITKAELMEDFKSIEFAVNTPIENAGDIGLSEVATGLEVDANIDLNSDGLTGRITAAEELDIGKAYQLSIAGYGTIAVGLNNIYSTKRFEELYTYQGELGAIYTESSTEFVLWAPTATDVKVNLYDNGSTGSLVDSHDMTKGEKGTWKCHIDGDLNGRYYTYQVTVAGKTVEAVDPYARATGTNGQRGMVIDLDSTNPEGWKQDDHRTVPNQTDAIIYELHVRDLSIHPDSGIENKGKYKGLTETGTKHKSGVSTGLDHIKELGATHIHLLPVYDYLSVDESKIDTPQFNWGYDPQNYNVPEGFYSSDPSKGEVRVKEFKQMVKELHDNDMGVIMDVVYNHLGGDAAQSNFNKIVPGYYFRMDERGNFSNGSGCGNETASERSMMRKFMVDSVTYWASEYNIDGFRFDLMALHDIETMNLIREELDKINREIIMYGEGWTAGDTPLAEADRALKKNMPKLDSRIAAFSDDLRDGLKGSVFDKESVAFINGNNQDAKKTAETIKFGVVGSTKHPQIDYSKVNYSDEPWAKEPTQTVSYASAHDNHTLWDKIDISAPKASKFEKIRMDKFATAIVLTSQGMPFIHAGEEMLRTKGGDENSYKSPDSVNQLDWARKAEYSEVFDYYQGLITLRKEHPAFRMATTDQISKNLRFLDMPDEAMVGYEINGKASNDSWDKIVVIHNGSKEFKNLELNGEDWISVVDSERAGVTGLTRFQGNKVQVTPNSTHVFVDKASYDVTAAELESKDITIYVEKPEDWEKPYIWYAKDGNWETEELGEEPGVMEEVEGKEGWYKKEIKSSKEVEFLFNNGTWDGKIAQQDTGNNFQVMTKVAWVTSDGRIYSHDPELYQDKGEDSGDEDDEEGPHYDPDKDLAIYFRKPADWENAYIHSWGDLYNKDWPGEEFMSLKDSNGNNTGWYIYVFKGAKGKTADFVLTQGAEGPQSSDLSTDKTCWIDENFKIYDSEPSMTISIDNYDKNTYVKYFKDQASVKIKYTGNNIKKAAYTLDGSDPLEDGATRIKNNEIIRFGKNLKVGDSVTLRVAIDNGDISLTDEYIYTKMEDVSIDKTAFNDLRIYQIMVSAYRDGDKDIGHGTGYGPSHHEGDLKGITEALPYIKDLGMNAIWLTPIFESARIEGQDEAADRLDSTGYFTTDYFKIDPKFGSLEDAKELVDKAHQMGMYVFLDGVFGHHKAGVDIPASPSGYRITPGKGAEPNNPVHYDEETLNFYKEVATYWMDELEIDGWRLDQSYQVSIPMQDDNYWRQIREAVEDKAKERKANGHKWGTLGYMVGEDWSGEKDIQERTYGPDFAPGLHSAFDFPGRYRLVQVLAGEEHVEVGKYNQPARKLNEVFETHSSYADHAVPNLMIGNHDLVRFGDLIQRAPHLGYGPENPDYWKRHKAAISFLASYTGPITLFYGEEIGMECDGYINKGDTIPGYVVADDNVARMPGRLPTDGDGFSKDEQDLHEYTKKIMKLRSENPALWNGKRTHLLSTDTKYADLKEDKDNKVVYLLNTGLTDERFELDPGKIGAQVLVDGITGEEIRPQNGKYTVTLDSLTSRFLLAKSETDTDLDSGSNPGSGSAISQGTSKPEDPISILKDIASKISKEKDKETIKKLEEDLIIATEDLIYKELKQEAVIKDGKVSLSHENIKKQLENAQAIISEFDLIVKENNIQLRKAIRPTLNVEIDSEDNIDLLISKNVWDAIDKRAGIVIRTKDLALHLEHDTFQTQDYQIKISQEGNAVSLTTDAKFKEPIEVVFKVDKSINNYPAIYQITEDGELLVGGVYDSQSRTIKGYLPHFSLYTVKESSPRQFTDIGDLTWQLESINELSSRGYIAGVNEKEFAPHANTTRAEFAAMLTRVIPAHSTTEGAINFTDIKEGAWYYKSVLTAANEGWLVGFEDNTFKPSDPITRQEVAAVLSRILAKKGYLQTDNSPKGINVAAWAEDSVALYLREVQTKELVNLDMSENATRAEIMVMILEFLINP